MTITHNILRIGKFTEYKHYCEIEGGVGNVLSGKRTRDLALHFWLCFFFWHFQRPGVVAESRLPFYWSGFNQTNMLCSLCPNNSVHCATSAR